MDRKHYRAPWWTQPEAGTAVDTQWTSDRPRGGARGLLGSEGSQGYSTASLFTQCSVRKFCFTSNFIPLPSLPGPSFLED